MKYEEWIEYERARIAAEQKSERENTIPEAQDEMGLLNGESIEKGRSMESDRDGKEVGIFPA